MPNWLPQWLVNILVDMATKYGIPALMKVFSWVPAAVWAAIQELISHLKDHPNPQAVADNFTKKVSVCIGETCKV